MIWDGETVSVGYSYPIGDISFMITDQHIVHRPGKLLVSLRVSLKMSVACREAYRTAWSSLETVGERFASYDQRDLVHESFCLLCAAGF